MPIRTFFWLMTLISILCLVGCGLLPLSSPKDLKFYSVSLVGTNTLSLTKQKDIARYKFNRLPRKVLEVKFTSNIDLIQERERNNWHGMNLESSACQNWKDVGKIIKDSSGGYVPAGPIGMRTSNVYWNDIDVFINFEKSIPENIRPYIYHFYMDISRKRDQEMYDFRVSSEDVCFRISSAEMLRIGVRTNVVTIPKEAITEALRCEQSSGACRPASSNSF